jgi:hypothetical protein
MEQENKELMYPLNKKIICSLCGNTFSSHSQKGKRYYRCQGYTRKKICTAKKIDANKIEITIKDLTMKIIEEKWGEKPKNRNREEIYSDKAIHFVSDGLVQIKSNTLKLMMDMKDKDKTIEEKIEEFEKYSETIKKSLDFDIRKHIQFLRKIEEDEEEAFRKAGRMYFPHFPIHGIVMHRADHYKNLKPEEFFNTCVKEIYYNINEKKGYFIGKIFNFMKKFNL